MNQIIRRSRFCLQFQLACCDMTINWYCYPSRCHSMSKLEAHYFRPGIVCFDFIIKLLCIQLSGHKEEAKLSRLFPLTKYFPIIPASCVSLFPSVVNQDLSAYLESFIITGFCSLPKHQLAFRWCSLMKNLGELTALLFADFLSPYLIFAFCVKQWSYGQISQRHRNVKSTKTLKRL